jgi:hypothetical protein
MRWNTLPRQLRWLLGGAARSRSTVGHADDGGRRSRVANQALLVVGLVVDSLLFGLVPSVGRFTPTRATDVLTGLRVDHPLSPGAGAITLIAGSAHWRLPVSSYPLGRTSTDSRMHP